MSSPLPALGITIMKLMIEKAMGNYSTIFTKNVCQFINNKKMDLVESHDSLHPEGRWH